MSVSLLPSEAQEGGGGLLQSVQDATLTFEFTTFDYGGSIPVPVPALHVHLEFTDENGGSVEHDEYYSAGDPARLRPTKDGSGLQALVEGAGMTKQCKAMQFISSVVSANGGEEDIIGDNIKNLDGIRANLERKPDVDRPGLAATNSKGRARTILLVTEVVALPGEAGPKKGKPKPGAAKPAAGKPAGGGKNAAIRTKTVEAVEAVLSKNGETAASSIGQLIFREYKKDPDVKAMVELASDENFLSAKDTSWGFDGENLTPAEE